MGDKSPRNKEKKKKKSEVKVTSPIASSVAEPEKKTKKTYQGYEIVQKNFYVYCLKFNY